MTLVEVVNYYNGMLTKFNEVMFNPNGGLGIDNDMITIDAQTKAGADNVGKLFELNGNYAEGDIVSSNSLSLYMSIIDNNNNPLEDNASWFLLKESILSDGEIPIVASAIFVWKSDIGLVDSYIEYQKTENITITPLRNSRWVDSGAIDGNGNPILEEVASEKDFRISLSPNTDIVDDNYNIQVSCPWLDHQYGAKGNQYSILEKTKNSFRLCVKAEQNGSIDWDGSKTEYHSPNIVVGITIMRGD